MYFALLSTDLEMLSDAKIENIKKKQFKKIVVINLKSQIKLILFQSYQNISTNKTRINYISNKIISKDTAGYRKIKK